jgi:hypothetical protein
MRSRRGRGRGQGRLTSRIVSRAGDRVDLGMQDLPSEIDNLFCFTEIVEIVLANKATWPFTHESNIQPVCSEKVLAVPALAQRETRRAHC